MEGAGASSTDNQLGVVLYFCSKPSHLYPAEVTFTEPRLTGSYKTGLCSRLAGRGKATLTLQICLGQVIPLIYVLVAFP